jgi:hypothetical protein
MQKKFVYHRALNSKEAFNAFLEKEKNSDAILAAEGDVCWAYIEGAFVIYIHHPELHGKSLSNEKVQELLESGELFTLEKLFEINSNIHFILELKDGNGDLELFFKAFGEILKRHDVSNLLVDAFSLHQLQVLKKVLPHIKTSLHTKLVMGKYVLESTYQKPYLSFHNLDNLDCIDTITLSYSTTYTNLFNLVIDKNYKEVYDSGKNLNLGSIKSMENFEKALHSQCEYIYLRSKEVLENFRTLL